jgi:hypothetical protein
MSRKSKRDPIADLKEWNEHMYNPGYWINRISWLNLGTWRWMRRYTRLAGVLLFLFFAPLLAVEIVDLWGFIQASGRADFSDTDFYIALAYSILFIVPMLAGVYLFLQKPSAEEPSPRPQRPSPPKKKYPKRRKDYR